MICVVCGKVLKSAKSKENGFGPTCAKKIDKRAQKEIQAIVEQGLTCRILGDNIIQTEIPVEDPGQWPQTIDQNGKKWNYPNGKR
jgi:hypothetical protein